METGGFGRDLLHIITEALLSYLQELCARNNISASQEDLTFLALFYQEAMNGILTHWIHGELRMSREQLLEKMTMVWNSTLSSFTRSSQKPPEKP